MAQRVKKTEDKLVQQFAKTKQAQELMQQVSSCPKENKAGRASSCERGTGGTSTADIGARRPFGRNEVATFRGSGARKRRMPPPQSEMAVAPKRKKPRANSSKQQI